MKTNMKISNFKGSIAEFATRNLLMDELEYVQMLSKP